MITVRLTPKGGRDRLEGVIADADGRLAIKARVSAPPVDGAANAALIKLVSKELGLSKSKVSFHSGETSRFKRLSVVGDPSALQATLKSTLNT